MAMSTSELRAGPAARLPSNGIQQIKSELPGLARAMLALSSGIALSASSPASAALPTVPAALANYDLVLALNEDFAAATLNHALWTNVYAPRTLQDAPITKRSLWGNGEREVYFDSKYLGLGLDPFSISNGVLRIVARPLTTAQLQAVHADLARQPLAIRNSALKDVTYSSGLISSRDAFSQKYGYFEARARWSSGRGIWPAFWLLPENGKWPPEIDIMEAHGDKPTTIYQSTHSQYKPTSVTRVVTMSQDAQSFHRYGMLWLPGRIEYYVDGVKTSTIAAPRDMDGKMYLVLNLAVGGYWPGYPNSATRFPATMLIDYVRAWRFQTLP